MAFRFSQAALLRLRATLEQVEERALLRLWQEERRMAQELERAVVARREFRSRRAGTPSGGALLGADFQFADFVDARLELEERRMGQQITGKKQEIQGQLAIFREARRRREVIAALRNRELASYREEERRREQREMDDAFLLRLVLERLRG